MQSVNTIQLITPPIEQLIETAKKFGFKTFEGGSSSKDYDLNIVTIRSANTKSNLFDDTYCIFYKLNKQWKIHYFACTTDPGAWELQRPSFPEAQKNGTLIVKHDEQYRSCYQLGFHGGGAWRHVALLQIGVLKGYRDNNRDDILDMNPNTITKGLYGANHHAASLIYDTQTVDNYSAGCTVIQKPADHKLASWLWIESAKIWGNVFTSTLYHVNSLVK